MNYFRGLFLIISILSSIYPSLANDRRPLVKLDETVYLVDTIQISRSIIYYDFHTGYHAIMNFNGFPELKAMQKKSIRQLIDQGWALILPEHNDLLIKKFNNPVINDLLSKYKLIPDIQLKYLSLNWHSKHGDLYKFTEQPKCFVLFFIKGAFFTRITHEEKISYHYIRKIKFKDINAYYPFIVPLF